MHGNFLCYLVKGFCNPSAEDAVHCMDCKLLPHIGIPACCNAGFSASHIVDRRTGCLFWEQKACCGICWNMLFCTRTWLNSMPTFLKEQLDKAAVACYYADCTVLFESLQKHFNVYIRCHASLQVVGPCTTYIYSRRCSSAVGYFLGALRCATQSCASLTA